MTVVYSAKGSVLHSHYTSPLQLSRPQSTGLAFIYFYIFLTGTSMINASCRWAAWEEEKMKTYWTLVCTCSFREGESNHSNQTWCKMIFMALDYLILSSNISNYYLGPFISFILEHSIKWWKLVIVQESVNNNHFKREAFKLHHCASVRVKVRLRWICHESSSQDDYLKMNSYNGLILE